jgi:hypothetical protein
MLVKGRPIRGSWDIAQYANTRSQARPLGNMQQATRWNELSEAALAEGRTGWSAA